MSSSRSALTAFLIALFAAPAVAFSPEGNPFERVDMKTEKLPSWSGHRPWRAPDYSKQESTLGYGPQAFAVPRGMEKQVQFWVDIYTRYNTSQGVIHDLENVDIVYEVVDLREVDQLTGMPARAKEKLRQKTIDEAKTRAQALLRRLEKVSSPAGLGPREKRIWTAFRSSGRSFSEASEMSKIRFQQGLNDRMALAIYLSGRYLEDFEQIFRDNGLPIELTRLVFVESSFNVLARSRVGASGLWQLMPSTVRPHRMISAAVDLRNHPISATKMAARILRDNYRMLESWPLALTGYNHGPTGVRKMVEAYGTRDIVELVRNVKSRRSFGFASRNFYASFLAALEVEKNAPRYFQNVTWSKPLEIDEIRLPQPVKYKDLLSWHKNDSQRAQIHNPHLTHKVLRYNHAIPQGTPVAMPLDQVNRALAMLGKKKTQRTVATFRQGSSSARAGANAPVRRNAVYHRVKKGDTLTGIARNFGVELRDLIDENDIKANRALWVGERIRIPRD